MGAKPTRKAVDSREQTRTALPQRNSGRDGDEFQCDSKPATHLKSEWFTTKARGTLLVVQLTDKTRLLHFPRNAEVTALEHAEELLDELQTRWKKETCSTFSGWKHTGFS